jgi:hypothetical protein
MLRHRFPSYRRLMREGERGRGVILDVEERHAWTLGAFKWRLRVRVVGDAAVGREFTAMVDTFDLLGNFPHAGDVWPIRISEGGRADVDVPAIRAEIRAERERIEAEHLRLGLERAAAEEAGPPEA